MKVTFGQQTTKVKQLADLLSQEISMGKYKSDCTLPSINKLSREYQVSRDTVFKAFIDLKDRGIIDSTPGKGYYVTNKLTNILLLLDEYSPFKYSLYNSFIKKLSINYKVDLLFHQYNERLFNTILRESIGRYNKYIVMNFDNEKLSPHLYKIDSSKLLLLDFGKFDKKDYSYVCQDFDDSFYHALAALKEHLRKYQRLVLLFPEDIKHPRSSCQYFNTILRESIGRYNKYIVMNFDNEKLSPHLYKIDSSKLLLLDFGKFDKKDYSYVCQDFDDSFYHALAALKEHLRKYQRLVLLFPEDIKHPRSSCQYFNCFCQDYHIDSAIVENTDRIQVRKGEVYIAIRQIEVVNIIKQSRTTGLKCGEDFGLIAYNDTPAYEVIDQGITVLSINWEELGRKAAEFVLTGQEIRTYLPTEVHLRNSI